MRQCVKPIIAVFFLLLMHPSIRAQHYFFVEAEGGQAFYMKIYDTLYSSTGEGFLIIPKVTDTKVVFTVGFPKGLYSEVQFELTGMDKDRGFFLKHLAGNDWILFDRQSQEKYVGKGRGSNLLNDSASAGKKPVVSNDFASMLSEVTSDKSLIQEKPVLVKPNNVAKDSVFSSEPRKDTTAILTQVILPSEVQKFTPTLNKSSEKRSEGKIEIIYEDQFAKGKTDTVQVLIEMPVLVSTKDTLTQTDSNAAILTLLKPSDVACILPVATIKDIRTIQKKLLGLETEEAQLDHIEKMYKVRCFSVDQTKEIGWFFRDEVVRLKLFKRVLPLLRDKTNVLDLGVAFFKEENIRAFKALISQ